MGDFHQTGVITTLHRLGTPSLSYVEGELKECTRDRPIALVLPCLHTEIDGPALPRIVERLREVPYLNQVIVSISGTQRREEFARARKFFSALPGAVCLWASGPTVQYGMPIWDTASIWHGNMGYRVNMGCGSIWDI